MPLPDLPRDLTGLPVGAFPIGAVRLIENPSPFTLHINTGHHTTLILRAAETIVKHFSFFHMLKSFLSLFILYDITYFAFFLIQNTGFFASFYIANADFSPLFPLYFLFWFLQSIGIKTMFFLNYT